MKKITLMLFALVAFCWQSNAQFTESFDTEIPATWTVVDVDGGNGWVHTTANPYAGAGSARITYNSDAHDDYLITPQFTVTAGVSDRVSFGAAIASSWTETFEVRLSTTGTAPADFSVVLGSETATVITYENFAYDLSAYDGQPVYVAIRATGADRLYLYVDEFVNDAIPSCYAAEFASAVAVDDCDNSQFSILVDISDLGSSVNLEITNDAGVASTTVTATGEVTVGPFPIGTPVVLTLENENEDTCDVVLDSVLDFCPTAANTLDYYNLQWPAELTFPENEAADQLVFAQVYEAGLTDTTTGAAAGIEAWIGYSDTDTDPSGTGWTWEIAPFFSEEGGLLGDSNDQFAVAMQDLGLTEGTYYYASRFTLNAGPYMYGGIFADGTNGGAWDGTANISGVLTITEALPPINDACADAITINDGDSISGNTTGATNVEALTVCSGGTVGMTCDAAGDSTPNAGTLIFGTGVWYVYSSPGNESISIEEGANAFDSELQVWSGTCGALVCVAGDDDSGAGNGGFVCFDAPTAADYYIYVDGNAATGVGAYTLNLNVTPFPTCLEATNLNVITLSGDITATVSWDAEANATVGYNWVIMTDGEDPSVDTPVSMGSTAVGVTIATATGLTAATDYDFYVQSNCDTDGLSTFAGPFNFTSIAPPANTICDTAEVVTLGLNEAGPEVTGTNVGATDSGVPDPSCNDFYEGSDIWYSFTTPEGLEQITLDIASSGFSSTIAVIYDNCIDLNEIDCDTQFISNPTVTFEGLDAETTYLLRLYDFSGDSFGPISFNMSATTSLGIDTVENEAAFTYYPNPVKNTLTLNAQNTIEHVAMYNMLGQEVLRVTPNTVDSDLDMSHLQTGTYFVKVTIANVTETIRVIKQ